jgi:methionyl-tRNA formyltransferase
MLGGKRLKIIKAQLLENTGPTGCVPGTIVQALSDTLTVQCGAGALRLEEVQLEGKKKMLVDEFLRGSQVVSGTQLL